MATRRGARGTKQLGDMHERGSTSRSGRKSTRVQPMQRWWHLDEDEVPGALTATIRYIQQQQASFETQRQVCARLYGGQVPGSAYGVAYNRLQTVHPSLSGG
jgi:hypothetical protein